MAPCVSSVDAAIAPSPGRIGERATFYLLLFIVAAFSMLIATTGMAATGAGPSTTRASPALFLMQLVALVTVGRLIGEALQRLGQPSVMGPLVAGLLLGPSLFGLFWPEAQAALFPDDAQQTSMLEGVSHFGVLLLLLLAGMETDVGLIRRVGKAALSVSAAGIIVPFACGFALGEMLPDNMLPMPEHRLVTSLFLGTALSISSVKIVAMVVREMGFMRRDLGQVILASAVIDDTIGWIIIAITFGLAGSQELSLISIASTALGTLVFLAVSLTIGKRLVFHIIRWVNDNFVSEVPVLSAVVLIMLGMALLTNWIGVHDVLGAFVAGILVGNSPILTRRIEDQIRGVTTAFFMPVFFGVSGLEADLTVLREPSLLALAAILIVIASIGKFGGAFLGAWIGSLGRREALALGFGMNARGSTEVIVATIGLSIGALSQNLFTMIVAMAVITTMVMPPTLRWALARLPISEEEERRLTKEAFDERSFLSGVERLLLAAGDGASGKLMAQLSGLLAGTRGTPVTAFQVTSNAAPAGLAAPVSAPEIVADVARGALPAPGDEAAGEVHVLTVPTNRLDSEAIAAEVEKGYDLLCVGVDPTLSPDGGFSDELSRVLASYKGALALGASNGAEIPQRLNILLPVTGTAASRNAAEVACALVQRGSGRIIALQVSDERPTVSTRHARGFLRDLVHVADHYGAELTQSFRRAREPAKAIIAEAHRRGVDLIVLGVNRRTGDDLFFGYTAQEVLNSAVCPILLVSRPS